jgi:hypothetical protein
MQPSAQGIASLFMGNPGALAQRVQKDRETSPTGLPDDLRQLMALNIVTTENDAAKRQEAMNQLQSMAPPGSEPPTVADTLRQRAQQAIQARMVSEMQKQQAMQSMMGGSAPSIPPGVPQPQRQPQGIDELPVEFGMAGGGIVAFENGGWLDRLLYSNLSEPERRRRERLEAEAEERRTSPTELNRLRDLAMAEVAGGTRNPNVTQETMERLGMAPRRREEPEQQVIGQPPARVARPPRPAPAPAAQPPAQELMPPGVSEEMVLPEQTMSPVAMARADAERREKAYEERIGKPDTSQYDRLIAELERQKAGTAAPERGFAGLMEFLGQIAATPRGLSSMEAGALGARGVQALEREREAKRTGLIEKQIELEQKKIDANRQYAKDVFGVGTNEFDRMLRANMDMFKEKGEDNRLALKHAHDLTLEDLRYKRQVERDREQHRRAMIERGTPTAEMQREEKRIQMYMKEQEDIGNKVSYMDAVRVVRGLGGNAGLENAQTRMLREARKDIDDRLEQLTMEGKQKTPEYAQLSQQRKRLSDMIVGRVLKEAGVAGDPSGGVDKSNPLLK